MTKKYISVICANVALMLCVCPAHADGWDWDDIAAPYLQRLDTQTSSSGDAQRVNTVTHMETPWPRNVRNRRIPANGERMVGAVRRYQDGNKQRLPLARKEEKESSFEMPLEPPAEKSGQSSKGSVPGMGNGLGNTSKPANGPQPASGMAASGDGQASSAEQSSR